MDREALRSVLDRHGQPAYRARQVWAWLARGCGSYAQMTDLPAELRAILEEHVSLSTLTVAREQTARDGTVKALLATERGRVPAAQVKAGGTGAVAS